MEIYSRYKRTPKTASPAGEKEVDTFELKLNKKGVKTLVKTEQKEDIYTPKQLNKDDVNILKIMEKITRTGDTSRLNVINGVYGDLTQMPANTIESLNQVTKIKQEFELLPANIKGEFGQNAFEFATAVADGSAKDRINKALGRKVETVKPIQQPTQQVAQPTQKVETTQVAQPTQNVNYLGE